MRREIYSAIAEAYKRKPNSNFLIPIKVNECEIEDFSINPMLSMQDLWYADFHENSSKAYQDLLKIILGTASEDSTDITEETVEPKFDFTSPRQRNISKVRWFFHR